MKIIIVGCGKLGYTLTEQLSKEDHDITVIDIKSVRLTNITNNFDVMAIQGNGTSYSVLMEADIEHTDLLIVATGQDELNLLCCFIARKAGHCKTIARVRNPIYDQEKEFLKKEFGLAMIVNPDFAAAKEISRTFLFPSAIRIDTFAKGRVELLRFRIAKGSPLHGMSLAEIPNNICGNILISMVKRGSEVIIPSGSFVLQEMDYISLVASPKQLTQFFRNLHVKTHPVTNALLLGGGSITFYLARILLRVGIAVKIIEKNRDRCEELSELLPKADIIWGDASDKSILLEEGLDSATGVAALTGLDEENIFLSLFARTQTSGKIVTKINRITFDGIVDTLDLDSIVYPRQITAEYILQYVRSAQASMDSNMENFYHLEDGAAEAVEFKIEHESAVTNVPLEKLKIRDNILLCCINRENEVITPNGQDEIKVGDSVIVVSKKKRINRITDILEGR